MSIVVSSRRGAALGAAHVGRYRTGPVRILRGVAADRLTTMNGASAWSSLCSEGGPHRAQTPPGLRLDLARARPSRPPAPGLPTGPSCSWRRRALSRLGQAYRWLVSHPDFGPHITDYLAGKGLRPRAKVTALATLWASVLLSVLVFIPLLAADVVVLAIAGAVSAYILRLPTNRTRRGETAEDDQRRG